MTAIELKKWRLRNFLVCGLAFLVFVGALALAEQVFAQDDQSEHWARLVQLDPTFRSQGWQAWLNAAGVSWDSIGPDARQIEEETTPDSQIVAAGVQIKDGVGVEIRYPVCVTTDDPSEVTVGSDTRSHQPDLRNPSVIYTNVVAKGTVTIWVDCSNWGQIRPEGEGPQATAMPQPTQAPPPATAMPQPTQAPQPTAVFNPAGCPDVRGDGALLDEAASVLAGRCTYGAPPLPTPVPPPPEPEPEGFLARFWGWILAIVALIATVVAGVVAYVLASLGVVVFSLLCCLLPLILVTVLAIRAMRRRV